MSSRSARWQAAGNVERGAAARLDVRAGGSKTNRDGRFGSKYCLDEVANFFPRPVASYALHLLHTFI